MEENIFSKAKEIQDQKDMLDAMNKIVALQYQIQNPTRDGMINALSDAQLTARDEITQIEQSQGDTIPMPWACFSDSDLYRKLSQYQEGVRRYCIEKIGQKAFEELLKEAEKTR